MESLGKYLKKERETKKISLREISKSIKVREQFLKAVEEDRYDLLPSPTYVKGFLAAYAKSIGLDPNEVILRYENVLKEESISYPEVPPEKKILWNKRHPWAIGGVIVVGFVVIYFLFYQPSPPSVKPTKPTPPKTDMKETPRATSTAPVVEKPSVPEVKPAISLQLKAVERTWLTVQVDDQSVQDITLQPGEGISYRGMERIQMVVGNAGGLDITFNEKELERFGKSGEVYTLLFTPKDVEAKPREITQPPQD